MMKILWAELGWLKNFGLGWVGFEKMTHVQFCMHVV
jgi:hypothetical protein